MAVLPTPMMIPASTRALPTKKRRQRLGFGAAGGAGVSVVLMDCSFANAVDPCDEASAAPFRRNVPYVKKCEAAVGWGKGERYARAVPTRVSLRESRRVRTARHNRIIMSIGRGPRLWFAHPTIYSRPSSARWKMVRAARL